MLFRSPAVHAPGDPVGAPPLVPPLGWYMGRASGERLVERALLRVTPGQPGMALLEAHPVAGPPEPPESPAPSTEP